MPDPANLSCIDAQPGPVMAAISFDELGRQCLLTALRRAAHAGQSVIALHILHETERTIGLYRRHDRGEVLRPNLDVARALLADFSAEVVSGEPAAADVPVRRLVVAGVPQRRIAEVAGVVGAELVVVGGSPKSALERLLSRNLAGALLRRAPCPVVVVDADGEVVSPQDLYPGLRDRAFGSAAQTQ